MTKEEAVKCARFQAARRSNHQSETCCLYRPYVGEIHILLQVKVVHCWVPLTDSGGRREEGFQADGMAMLLL